MAMKIGYIRKYSDPCDTKRNSFRFVECSCTLRISSKSDRVYSKQFMPLDYEKIVDNANIMKKNPIIIIVQEPFLLDDELREKAVKWVEWANKADPSEYDPFAKQEVE